MADKPAGATKPSLWARSGAFRILVIVGLLALLAAPFILLFYVFREYPTQIGFALIVVEAVLIVVGRRRIPRKRGR